MRLMMAIDSSRIRLPGIIVKGARVLGLPLRGFGVSQRNASAARTLLTPEQFQEELVFLNLSGKRFSPEVYSEALGNY